MTRKPFRDCSIDGCHKPAVTRGWCSMHYTRWYRHGSPHGGATYRRNPTKCKGVGCHNKPHAHGLCKQVHLARFYRTGDPRLDEPVKRR